MLELAADVPLNIVCFRYRDASDDENKEILMRLQESGLAVPSGTVIGGRFAIRVAIYESSLAREDFDMWLRRSRGLGAEVCERSASAQSNGSAAF